MKNFPIVLVVTFVGLFFYRKKIEGQRIEK